MSRRLFLKKKREKLLCVEWEGFALISISIIKSIKNSDTFPPFFDTYFWVMLMLEKMFGFEYIDELNIMPPVVYPPTATTTPSNMMMTFSWLFPWENLVFICCMGNFLKQPKAWIFLLLFRFFLLIIWVCVEQSQFTKNSL